MKRQRQKLLSIVLFVLMTINLLPTVALATEEVSEKVVARPLVIMMEYQDYKFSDIDTKESDWRLRGIPGDEYTPEFVQELLFAKENYTGENGQQFMSVRKYYDEITAGNFCFNGKVVGPYTAKKNASYYGSDRNRNGSDQDEAMLLVREAVHAVTKDPNVDLSQFDVENRTGDGEFGVSDGVIDTVIVIHPGLGEEWGGGSLKETAIWPFRCGFTWYSETDFQMEKAKDYNGKEWLFDDFVLIAQDSASDMLCHEYGHVLGLPDLYGFSGSEPPAEKWCIMGGSYTGKDIAGTMPNSYGAYCREFLQKSFEKRKVQNPKWANIQNKDFSDIGKDGLDIELHQAHERLDGKTDLFRIDIPKKETVLTTPTSGEYAYFSGNDNNSRNHMKTTVDLTNYKKAKLEFKTWYKIDPYFDFATVRVNEVGSEKWETVEGNITTTKFDDWLIENETEEQRLERNPGYGITDESDGWVDAEFDLSKYSGKEIELTFYFWTDSNTPEEGIYIDDIVISGVEKGQDEITKLPVLGVPGGSGTEVLEEDEVTETVNTDGIEDLEEDEATETVNTDGIEDLKEDEATEIVNTDGIEDLEEDEATETVNIDGIEDLKEDEATETVNTDRIEDLKEDETTETVNRQSIGDAIESDTNVIELNKKIEGTFTEEEYTHWYNFTLTEKKTLKIVAEYDEGLEGICALYDKEGEWITEENRTVEVPAGTYDLAIWAIGDNKEGNYSFMILGQEDPDAIEIQLNKKIDGTFTHDDYSHRYKFTLLENKKVNIGVQCGEDMEITWTLYDENDEKVDCSDEILEILRGTYYLVVESTGNNKEGNYSIIVSEESTGSTDSWVMIFEDDVESEAKFNLEGGFTRSKGEIDSEHYYLLEWRNIEEGKVDEGLGHIYYGWPEISYDPGLLVWYVNKMWINYNGRPDQQVADHPGECFAGVVDADQNPVGYDYSDGKYYDDPRVDFTMHDAAFSLRMENKFYHDWGQGIISKDLYPFMVPEFDDSKDYTNPINPQAGLKLPDYGIKILVTEETSDRSSAKIHIMNSRLENNSLDYSDGLNVKDIKIEDNTILIQAENNSSIDKLGEKAYIGYISKDDKGKIIEMKQELDFIDGVYKCDTDFLGNVEKGKYQVNFIILEDAEGNARAIYNSKVHFGYGMDLSGGDVDSEELPIINRPVKIRKIKAFDKDEVEKVEFAKGNTILINTTLDVLDEIDSAVVIIEVKDKNGVPYALRYVPFNKEITEYSLGFSTYGLEKGQNNVTVYIWDNINNKKPLSETETFTFIVK